MDKDEFVISSDDNTMASQIDQISALDISSIDTITLDNTTLGSFTVNSNGTGGPYAFSNSWTSAPYITSGSGKGTLSVAGDAEIEGDIKWKGRSLQKLLEKIEDRLAILPDPDPAKLEKFAALKKAYEHYKTLERLIGED